MNPKEEIIKVIARKQKERPDNILDVTQIIYCPFRSYPDDEYNFYSLAGLAVHEYIQKRLGEDWEMEVPVRWHVDKYEIHGRVDLLNRKEKVLVELKTGSFSAAHVLQIRFYLNAFPDFKGYLIYLPRTIGKFDKIEEILITNPLTSGQIEALVWAHVKKNAVPLLSYCNTCPLKNDCKIRGFVMKSIWE